MLTLSNDDYKGQTSVIVKNGIATSEPYSANGNNLSSGKYVLSVSMSEPGLQSNNVRAIVGETGENMTGKYVQTSDIDNTKFISGNFKFSLKLKKEKIVEKYDNEIVVCCKMFLDNFISNYDVSLAPQMWTLVKFDKKGAIIAITDVTFDFMSEVQKAMIVFTPNIDDGKMLGGTPHYIAVGDTVYGDDGYCDKLFSKLKKFIAGDVVVLPFPFTDLSFAKKRPALILANLVGDDYIMLQITSKNIYDAYAIPLLTTDFSYGSLHQDGNIRPNKIFTLDKKLILYKIGHLNNAKLSECINAISDIISKGKGKGYKRP